MLCRILSRWCDAVSAASTPRRAFVAAVASQGPPIEKDRHLVKEFGVLGEAMNWARTSIIRVA
jgi:hypothetical protein